MDKAPLNIKKIVRFGDDNPFFFPSPAFDKIEDFGDPKARWNPRLLADYGRNVYKDGVCIGYCLDVRIPGYRALPMNQIEAIGFEVDGQWIPDEVKYVWYEGRDFPLSDLGTGLFDNNWMWKYQDYLRIFLAIPGGIEQDVHHVKYGVALRDHYNTRACCEKDITIL
ncbi:MAG: hypothetical protein E7449_00830 [Ruminococcaceae bacterium]|nr:hypothetical protein [Oscillospiraceae bacterium]